MKHLVLKTIVEELKIRVYWIWICLSLTWVMSYIFSKELIFLLAKPLLYPDLFFICTQLTEALSTQLTTSSILCFYFAFPCMIYSMWCFLIPSCSEKEKKIYKLLFSSIGFCFFFLSFATFVWLVPNLWHFFYGLSITSTNLLTIKLQLKISDYISLTVRALCILLLCTPIPVIVFFFLKLKTYFFRKCLNNRRMLRVYSLFMAALFTPPDIWFQIVSFFFYYVLLELTLFVALIMRLYKISPGHSSANAVGTINAFYLNKRSLECYNVPLIPSRFTRQPRGRGGSRGKG
nr:Sec-independent protein translocase [Haplopteris ensiformis]